MEDSLRKAIEQMKSGEEKGFNEVYSKTYNRVYFRARQIMKKEEDAQDLTQIVFVEAFKGIGTLQSAEAIYSWLDGITYRQGMKIFRKRKDVLLKEEAEGLFDTLESNDITTAPELSADQKATSEIIRGIMDELPELQKTAVVMYYFDGMKVEAIADIMECSVNTIKSRLSYARKYLKDRVEEKEKKEGYRLHVFGAPVLWYAIKAISEETTLTAQAAQGVYSGACTNVGLQATAIEAGGSVGASSASAATAGSAQTATAAKAVGIAAKFTALSTAVKILIAASVVVVVGVAAGTAYLVNENAPEEVISVEALVQEAALEETEQVTLEEPEEIEEAEPIEEKQVYEQNEDIEVSEEAFGDVDVDRSSLNMDMMSVQQVGLDISYDTSNVNGDYSKWTKEVNVLFVAPMYQTEQGDGFTSAEMDNVLIMLATHMVDGEPLPSNDGTIPDTTQYGDIILYKHEFFDTDSSAFGFTYLLYDTKIDITMSIYVGASYNDNSSSDSDNAFRAEYAAALEKTIRDSF